MQRSTLLAWSWLGVLTKKRYEAMLVLFGDLEKALAHVDALLLKEVGCRDDTIEDALRRLDTFDAEAYEERLRQRDLHLVCIEDGAYPRALREIGDPPFFLMYRGDFSLLDQPCLALVGTRRMSNYGRRVTAAFVPPLVFAGVVTVSGLAHGVDAQVARETLACGGKTVACLGHGLAQIYPQRNVELAEEIVAKGGLLMSEFPLDYPPDKFTFPSRNRIIAGLSLGTIVLEAPEGSGAIITAELSLDYNRDVFAVPGQIFDPGYAGCHRLIAGSKAALVQSPSDVLRALGVIVPEQRATPYGPQNNEEACVLRSLTTMPQSIDELRERSEIETALLNATLTILELRGVAKNLGGGMWVRA